MYEHSCSPTDHPHSHPIKACSGTKRSMKPSPTTKTGPSSTPSSSRTVWPPSPLSTRRRPNSSRRRSMSVRRMRARRPKPLRSVVPARPLPIANRLAFENTVDWGASAASYIRIESPPRRPPRLHPARSSFRRHRPGRCRPRPIHLNRAMPSMARRV